jgi:hypothetical protein
MIIHQQEEGVAHPSERKRENPESVHLLSSISLQNVAVVRDVIWLC